MPKKQEMSRRVKPNTNASRRTDVNTKQTNKKHDFLRIPSLVIIDSDGKVLNECLGLNPFLEALKLNIPAEELDRIFKE